MLALAQCGALIMPPMPAFYAGPQTTREMVDLFVGRLLDHLGIDNTLTYVYEGV
ncbi:MAG: flavoprotein [Bacillota bacterium]